MVRGTGKGKGIVIRVLLKKTDRPRGSDMMTGDGDDGRSLGGNVFGDEDKDSIGNASLKKKLSSLSPFEIKS